MTESKYKLVLVDTNCLIRVFFSPLSSVLGQPASGYELKTLESLANELKNIAKRRNEYAWLGNKAILADVNSAILPLSQAQQQLIEHDAAGIQQQGNSILLAYCKANNIPTRALSRTDARVLAATLELNSAMATDEWPLRRVAAAYNYDDGNSIQLFSSVELIALLENEGLLSKGERKKIYADWLKFGEQLLRESGKIYYELFGEMPPDAQH